MKCDGYKNEIPAKNGEDSYEADYPDKKSNFYLVKDVVKVVDFVNNSTFGKSGNI